MGLGHQQLGAEVEDFVLAPQVRVQLRDLMEDSLGGLKGLLGAPVGGAPQDALADQDHQDQQPLDQVSEEEQERER
jgi:hypothetical protein